MPAPVLSKTWQYDVNQRFGPGTNTTTAKEVLLGIKTSLIGFASSPWAVWGSCDGAGGFGNGDAVDRWVDITDLVGATAGLNHSWVVLSQPGLGNNASICIDFTADYTLAVYLSPAAGFGLANGGTDGTAIACPTASDMVSIYEIANDEFIGSVSEYQYCLHVMESTDGECTRIFLTFCAATSPGRSNYLMWMIDKAKNPKSEWTNPVFGTYYSYAGNPIPRIEHLSGKYMIVTAAPKIVTRINGVESWLSFTSEGLYVAPLAYNQLLGLDDTSNALLAYGVGIISFGMERGRKGEVYDLWFGFDNSMMDTGDQYEDFTFAQFHQVIVPWNGTKMIV